MLFRSLIDEAELGQAAQGTPTYTVNTLTRIRTELGKTTALALIIGSDQVALLEGKILGKPGNYAAAVEQLRAMSGRSVDFHTALCLLNAGTGRQQTSVATVTVTMRKLGPDEIERYLSAEPAFDCAGSARIEALGITLVEKIGGDDPNALIGLPLIDLCRMLRAEGVSLP